MPFLHAIPTGFNLFNQKTREFEFHPGPVFADELNRTTPRTQSALLEAMAERQVTIDAVPHTLSDTFFVIATQNPSIRMVPIRCPRLSSTDSPSSWKSVTRTAARN